MHYYHIDPVSLKVISGPVSLDSTYVRKLTSCGNPELLSLEKYGLVPDATPAITKYQKYGEPIVYPDRVELEVLKLSDAELEAVIKAEMESKIAEIKSQFGIAEYDGVMTSFGFMVDANRKSVQDVQCIIAYMQATKTETITFRDYNNEYHDLTLEQVQQVFIEMIANGLQLYQKKWAKENEIMTCKAIEDIQAVRW